MQPLLSRKLEYQPTKNKRHLESARFTTQEIQILLICSCKRARRVYKGIPKQCTGGTHHAQLRAAGYARSLCRHTRPATGAAAAVVDAVAIFMASGGRGTSLGTSHPGTAIEGWKVTPGLKRLMDDLRKMGTAAGAG